MRILHINTLHGPARTPIFYDVRERHHNDLCTRLIFGRVQRSFFGGDVITIVRCIMYEMSTNTQYGMNMYMQYEYEYANQQTRSMHMYMYDNQQT